MPSAAFQSALPFILRWEGGYVNHPNDRGGATNRGITQKVYDGWRQQQGSPARDVRQLEEAELQAIYEANYWRPVRCGELGTPLDDLVHFDTAVNTGPNRAVRMLQQAVGAEVDGRFGGGTLQCVRDCGTDQATITYCDAREQFYRAIVARRPDQGVFLKGWMNRLNALRKTAGLPGYESADDEVDFGDTEFIARVADIDASAGTGER